MIGARERGYMSAGMPKPRSEKLNFHLLNDLMAQLEWDLSQPLARRRALPRHWRQIAVEPKKRSRKKRSTLASEEDLLKSLAPSATPISHA